MNESAKTIEVLHSKYAGIVYHHCKQILGDRVEAEDAVQETFISAYRALKSRRYEGDHLPWLYRIATNASLKFLRTKRRKGVSLTEHPERFGAPELEPGNKLFARHILQRLMDEIDDTSSHILVAHYISGMSQGQIADSLEISRRAVVKRLTTLRTRVSRIVEEEERDG